MDAKTVFVSDGGGQLDIVAADGEVLMSVAVPPGRVRALPYRELLPDGATLQPSSGVAVIQLPHRIGIQSYGARAFDSGANPDYRPTAATRMEREMRLAMRRLQASESRVDAKLRALSKVERIPDAPAPAPVEVIETPEPAPVKAEEKAADGQ